MHTLSTECKQVLDALRKQIEITNGEPAEGVYYCVNLADARNAIGMEIHHFDGHLSTLRLAGFYRPNEEGVGEVMYASPVNKDLPIDTTTDTAEEIAEGELDTADTTHIDE